MDESAMDLARICQWLGRRNEIEFAIQTEICNDIFSEDTISTGYYAFYISNFELRT
jgi:hypothetical protein